MNPNVIKKFATKNLSVESNLGSVTIQSSKEDPYKNLYF